MDSNLLSELLGELEQNRLVLSRIREQLPPAVKQAMASKEAAKDLKRMTNLLGDILLDSAQKLQEYGNHDLARTALRFQQLVGKFPFLTVGCRPLCQALETLEDQLLSMQNTIDPKLGHLMNQVKMGYFPTDSHHVSLLKKGLAFPDSEVNLLDPCCGEGIALAALGAGENAVTYGVEIDEARAEEARTRLHHVGIGSYFQAAVSQKAFHAVFLNPPYLSLGGRRQERAFLGDSLFHLLDGGILIYIIPYYRATREICQTLCAYLTDLSIYRFIGREYERFSQIVFLGKRRQRREEVSGQVEQLLNFTLTPENIPLLSELPTSRYPLPGKPAHVKKFQGAVFNLAELAQQFRQDNRFSQLFTGNASDGAVRQPPLPLNINQIGLVGSCGEINGLIACETPHIIKGRVVKEKKTTVTPVDNKTTEIRETVSNKLIFNVLTQDGLKQLT